MSTVQNANLVRTEFAAAINQIATERKIEAEDIYEAIRQALVSAYRKQIGDIDETFHYYVDLDKSNGSARILRAPMTKRDEETLEILEWDEKKTEDVTPAGFGRIAAQTAKQVILQRIRRSERDTIIAAYRDRIGEVVTGQVLRMQGRNVILDIGRGQAFMPPEEQMRGEFYRLNQRLAVLIKEISETVRGEQIIVTRASAELVSKLFEREVPEVSSGAVEIVAIAREAGVRTKLTVKSTQEGVDPVGSCVGQRGVRVQKVIEELNNEKVDIIPYSADSRLLLQASLAPAEGLQIEVDDKIRLVTVTAPDDQLSLVIGRGGQNVRLAAKLTGYQITVKSASGQVQSSVTGKEDYEIDTFGLEDDSREILIQHKLTTLADLVRFRDKWVNMNEVAEKDQKILLAKVEEYLEQESKRE
ncbi:MAG: NusA antitermination factor [Candidatus Pacebacteria bacterium GW2011_GWF2_38_9]|nr:MAG: NusA antitermination factor, N utilization substance protein A [candidate division TM6 bacterium GW2011_GWF2_28_16]KKQ09138.1 MAG: NusA antitermination factor [Candidatus Pacebacteria bacterium GW2011_GWF1_36_5]KKQ88516.1 MAG: NusA antitermination factor [Candidatus Pacebacteria bacterium GW2011_GWF2_38_9]MBU1033490.1 transcription termination factor NusA [Patescibacteria group bacterium]HAZ73349.1 transcription termination/antitermination protein NusA [Candidatus Paceibacterota bacteri